MALTKDIEAWLKTESGRERTSPSPEHEADLSSPFKYRILVVDDDEKLLVKSSTVLIREGYEVRTARDGFDALAVLRDSLPDLLISDLKMPNMTGFELLSVVRRRFPSVAVIAFSDEFAPAKFPAVLCDQFIEKGAKSNNKLLACVRDLLSQLPLRAQPAKVNTAPVWIPRPATGYVLLTCSNCMRSFPLTMRSASIGEVASAICDYCEAEVNYYLDDSALPNADEVEKIKQGLRQPVPHESAN